MARRLIWSLRAQTQRKRIFDYWNERNGSKAYSRKLNDHFNESAELLIEHPEIGRETSRNNVRIKIVGNYLMVYRFTDEEVAILVIWDSRRNPSKLGYRKK